MHFYNEYIIRYATGGGMKYDWIELKKQFLLGDYKSLKNFAETENIDYGLLRKNAIGWVKIKKKQKEQNCNKTITKIETKKVLEAVKNYEQINKKHYDFADNLLKKLAEIEIKNTFEIESAARALKNLQQIQRLAKNMDKIDADADDENVEILIEDIKR